MDWSAIAWVSGNTSHSAKISSSTPLSASESEWYPKDSMYVITDTDRLMECRKFTNGKFPGLEAAIRMLLSINILVTAGKGAVFALLSLPRNRVLYVGKSAHIGQSLK